MTTERTPARGNGGAGRYRTPKIDQAECIRLYREGWSIRQLAEKYDVARSAVRSPTKVERAPQPVTHRQSTAAVRPPAAGWEERAACRGLDDDGGDRFHPSVDDSDASSSVTKHRAYENARNLCRTCPVTVACLRTALAAETASSRYGIWGGLSPKQRSEIPARPTSADLVAAVQAALVVPEPATLRTDFTIDEQRAANTARDAHRAGRRGPLTPDEAAAYRAYQRRIRRERQQTSDSTYDVREATA